MFYSYRSARGLKLYLARFNLGYATSITLYILQRRLGSHLQVLRSVQGGQSSSDRDQLHSMRLVCISADGRECYTS